MIAIVRRQNVVLGYPMTSPFSAPFWYVNSKLKICILKIKTMGGGGALHY